MPQMHLLPAPTTLACLLALAQKQEPWCSLPLSCQPANRISEFELHHHCRTLCSHLLAIEVGLPHYNQGGGGGGGGGGLKERP